MVTKSMCTYFNNNITKFKCDSGFEYQKSDHIYRIDYIRIKIRNRILSRGHSDRDFASLDLFSKALKKSEEIKCKKKKNLNVRECEGNLTPFLAGIR